MAFWSDLTGKDPKRNFRFRVLFSGLQDTQTSVWWAKKVTKPNFTVAESKHVYLNHSFYWPGRVEWQAITMTLVDPVDPGSNATLNKLMEEIGYLVPKDPNTLTTQSKAKSNTTLGPITIEQIDADGNALETWTLHAPFIKKITFGELDYENDDLTQVEVELRYDWATCEIDGVQRYSLQS
jgi:hypothetical protein